MKIAMEYLKEANDQENGVELVRSVPKNSISDIRPRSS